MAIFHSHRIRCACGNELEVSLARSVNVRRSPALREKILSGEFHSFTCPACKQKLTVERPFAYSDPARRSLFLVCPRSERHTWRKGSRDLKAAAEQAEAILPGSSNKNRRVVFGLDELREKLLAQQFGIDDRLVELLKVYVIYEHPFLTRRPRLRLCFDGVRSAGYEFVAGYEHGPERYRVTLPRDVADALLARRNDLRDWETTAHRADSVFNEEGLWVNLWRWSPQPSALESLRAHAERLRAGQLIDVRSSEFTAMLKGLPRGAHLPPWAKKDLRTIEDYVRRHTPGSLEDQLFEIRFDLSLADDWAANDKPDDIATLWQLLDALPDSNVEGNSKIHEIKLVGGGGGVYQPTTHDIEIGEEDLPDEQGFRNVVRHEVGHAVYEMLDAKVDRWLTT